MKILPIRTRVLTPPKDDLFSVLDESLYEVQERDIVIVTCKVLSIHEGRCLKKDGKLTRARLGKRECDWYIDYGDAPESEKHIPTIKNHTLLGSAGVDASNSNGYFILPPENVEELCREIWEYARKRFGIREVGVMAVDSHTLPFRYGVTGVAMGLWGFKPLRAYKGAEDIFGNHFNERVNIADALGAMTTLCFGEGNETTPILIAREVAGIEFCEEASFASLCVPEEEDIFHPIYKVFKKKQL